jgi:hypothetical protein
MRADLAVATARGAAARRGRRVATAALALALVAIAGNAHVPAATGRGFGIETAFCDSCDDAVINTFGVEFRNGDLWTMAQDGTITRLDHCTPVQVISVQGFRGFATGFGWDSKRDQFIVADAQLEEISVIDMRGDILREFPAPNTGAIGAAYDPTRDSYWITDYDVDSLYQVDPLTGARGAAFYLPRHSRVAGAAYDAQLDAIVYQTRTLPAMAYATSCVTGAIVDSFPIPYTGFNGWEDNAIGPNGSYWAHDYELQGTYCIERISTPVIRSTWGALKQRFR